MKPDPENPPETPVVNNRLIAFLWWLISVAGLALTALLGFVSAHPGWTNWITCTGMVGILTLIALFFAIKYSRIARKK
jgi:FtsH-binding integral membrane protein